MVQILKNILEWDEVLELLEGWIDTKFIFFSPSLSFQFVFKLSNYPIWPLVNYLLNINCNFTCLNAVLLLILINSCFDSCWEFIQEKLKKSSRSGFDPWEEKFRLKTIEFFVFPGFFAWANLHLCWLQIHNSIPSPPRRSMLTLQYNNDCEGNMMQLRIILLLFSALVASSLSEGITTDNWKGFHYS